MATENNESYRLMIPQELNRMLSKIPLFHVYFILNLITPASVGLTFSLTALLQEFRSCPVLSVGFILFWFYSAVCVVQLSLGLFILVALIFVLWRQHPRKGRTRTRDQVARFVAPGDFFSQPNICLTDGPNSLNCRANLHLLVTPYTIERTKARCCPSQCNYSSKFGCLQSVATLSTVLLVAHLVALVWSCTLRRELRDPHAGFQSRVISLFIEAKLQTIDYSQTKIHTPLVSKACWNHIQKEFNCCGAVSFSDWLSTNDTHINITEYNLPDSCYCSAGPNVCSSRGVFDARHALVYTRGCIEPLAAEIDKFISLLLIVSPCCFILLLTSFLADLIYTLKTADTLMDYCEQSCDSISERQPRLDRQQSTSISSSC